MADCSFVHVTSTIDQAIGVGLDHRTAHCELSFLGRRINHNGKIKSMKDWRPTLDVSGESSEYWKALSDPILLLRVSSFRCAEELLYKAGSKHGNTCSKTLRFKPSPDLTSLQLARRRGNVAICADFRLRGQAVQMESITADGKHFLGQAEGGSTESGGLRRSHARDLPRHLPTPSGQSRCH